MQLGEIAGIVIALAALVLTVAFAVSHPQRSIGNDVSVKLANDFHLVGTQDGARTTVEITPSPAAVGRTLRYDIRDNSVFETRDQAAAGYAKVTQRRQRVLFDLDWPLLDVGPFAGFDSHARKGVNGREADDRLQLGLAVSPVTLLYGTTAPELLLSRYDAGLGVSFYAPADLVGSGFSHIGIGYARMFDYRGGDSSNLFYARWTARLP